MKKLTFPDDNVTIEINAVDLAHGGLSIGKTICYRILGESDLEWKKIEWTSSNNMMKVITQVAELNSFDEFLDLQARPI